MTLNELKTEYQEQCRQALTEEKNRSLSESNNWAHVDRTQVHAEWDSLYKQFAPLIDVVPATENKVQELIEQHYQIACRFYKPSKAGYIGMALFYCENVEMNTFHSQYHPKLVQFLGDAICAYSFKHL